MKDKQLVIYGVAAAALCGLAIWNYLSRRNQEKMRLRKSSSTASQQRAGDQRPLTRQEQRIKKQAQKLIEKKKILPAAQMLEQAGFYRDAIDALENNGFYDDAARALIRLQRPGRAGVLYSRNGLFGPAAQCFLQAGDSLNAAKCFREAGNFVEAAGLFSKTGQHGDAAECLEKSGLLADAAKNWLRANKAAKAIECWNTLGNDPAQIVGFKPHHDEIEIMLHALKDNSGYGGIIKLLARSTEAANHILSLLALSKFESAAKIFEQAPAHVSASLLGFVNIQSNSADYLVDLFKKSGQHRNAGILLEQMERFPEAYEEFMAGGDSERARYCKNRSRKVSTGSDLLAASENQEGLAPASAIPKASFFIDSATQNALKAGGTLSNKISFSDQRLTKLAPPPATDPVLKLPLTNDEERLLSRSWLFQNVNEAEVELLVSRFTAAEYLAGHRIQCGSPDLFLVMAVTGDFVCSNRQTALDGWLSPEIGLSEHAPLEWLVTSSNARVAYISALDFSAILSRDADLTRQVYTNLTQRVISETYNPLISKAG